MNDDDPVSFAEFGIDAEDAAELVRLAARLDPVPRDVLAGAKEAFAWRSVDAELAELVYDSALDEAALAGVRSGGGARQLTFEGPGLTVEVEVALAGRLVGQLVPPRPGRVEVRHPQRTFAVEADALGRFAADVPSGPVSFSCRLAEPFSTGSVETDWVVL